MNGHARIEAIVARVLRDCPAPEALSDLDPASLRDVTARAAALGVTPAETWRAIRAEQAATASTADGPDPDDPAEIARRARRGR